MMMDLAVTQSTTAHHHNPPHPADMDERLGSIDRPERVGYQTSPHAPNTPENNVCKLVDYRNTKVASFTVNGRELICLPQAFELFLKHLVGGLHTVYTKLKRLEITPVVCNVEQVRILRGVAAIQPGVNRCKLISPQEFDVLYEDCTSSSARPGRPPKRSSHYLAEMSETSPTKLARKSSESMFHFDDLKHMPGSGVPGIFSPPSAVPQSGYPGLHLPGMPFVSPFQLNLMQQAAVQMALANQIQQQQSNMARAKDMTAALSLHTKSKPQAIRETQLPTLPLHNTANPVISSHGQTFTQTEEMKRPSSVRSDSRRSDSRRSDSRRSGSRRSSVTRAEPRDSEPYHHSPVSSCGEDLIVDKQASPSPSPSPSRSPHTIIYTDHTNVVIDSRGLSSSIPDPEIAHSQETSHRQGLSPPPSTSVSSTVILSTNTSHPTVDITSSSYHINHEQSERVVSKQPLPLCHTEQGTQPTRQYSPSFADTLSQSVTRDNTTTEHKEKTNLDSILGNIKSDIKSFMDSVIQHQEDIISDIESLRNSLKTQSCDPTIIEAFMREQQQTKAMYQAQIEKENLHKQQIDSLLRLAKSDIHNQWWNRT